LATGLTRAAAAAGSKPRQDLVRYLDIRIYVPSQPKLSMIWAAQG
jgi:hypothetical protein